LAGDCVGVDVSHLHLTLVDSTIDFSHNGCNLGLLWALLLDLLLLWPLDLLSLLSLLSLALALDSLRLRVLTAVELVLETLLTVILTELSGWDWLANCLVATASELLVQRLPDLKCGTLASVGLPLLWALLLLFTSGILAFEDGSALTLEALWPLAGFTSCSLLTRSDFPEELLIFLNQIVE